MGSILGLGLKLGPKDYHLSLILVSNFSLFWAFFIKKFCLGVSSYNHLGKLVTETNDATPAVREKILKGNRCLYGLHNILRSRYITANTKVLIYNSTSTSCNIWPGNLHDDCEAWKKLEIFELKALRRIYGPINDDHEIKQIYRTPSITEYLKEWMRVNAFLRNAY